MPSYAVFLRGVSPMTLRMPDLAAALEAAGFTEVRTLLSSGNAVFAGARAAPAALERKIEGALRARTGREFPAFVRTVDSLRTLLESEPYGAGATPAGAKRVVTFLREPPRPAPRLPVERDGARVLRIVGREAFSDYRRTPKGPVFMQLIEATLGEPVTTRTWETVRRVAAAGATGPAGEPARRRR